MNQNIDSKKFASIIAKIADEKLGKDIIILDISKISMIADVFVLVTAQSTIQVKAITENICELIKKKFKRVPIGKETDSKNRWNLIDFGDVVVHILHKEEREIYALEKFWDKALSIDEQHWKELSKDFEIFS